ncbi:MAG: AtpZ/AtpI family protein [Ilumatobacteraceae bacterium]
MKLLPIRKPVARTAVSSNDSLGRGAEVAVSVGVFFGIGWVLDRAFQTRPIFMIVCSLFSILGSFARLWYVYDGNMRVQEVERQNLSTSHMRKSSLVGEK